MSGNAYAKVVPFREVHADVIREKNMKLGIVPLDDSTHWRKCTRIWRRNPSYTLIMNGKIIGCAGVVMTGKASGEAWALLSNDFYRAVKTSYRAIRDGLDSIIRNKKLVRVQSIVLCGNAQEVCGRFLEHLGFSMEGLLRKFGPNGEDVILYAKIMEG